MATLATVADYIADARTLLQDKIAPYRYADDELLVALNVTIDDTRRLRPDLFLGDGMTTTLDDVPSYDLVDTTAVDIQAGFRLPILYGVVAHAILRDQEDIQDQRATTFMKLFRDKLLTLDI